MPFKGFNSILFDFDSIVDKEISLIKFFAGEYRESATIDDFINIRSIPDDTILKFRRMFGTEDLFRSLLVKLVDKDRYDQLINLFFDRDQKDIFENGYAFTTSMTILISAYKKTGNGIIRTAVRCDNEYQKDFVRSLDRDIPIIIKERKDVDMSKYGRIIVGQYSSALEYRFDEPKSILILNYMENFDSKDNTLLNPELVISLGDIHKIEIISAFQDDDSIKG